MEHVRYVPTVTLDFAPFSPVPTACAAHPLPLFYCSTNDISEYSVLAETEQDFSATVKFASDHNLRLVVKATGHDWYGRSTAAGSLLLWTHKRKNITWHDSFVAEGCATSTAVPAVTVQSGVQ